MNRPEQTTFEIDPRTQTYGACSYGVVVLPKAGDVLAVTQGVFTCTHTGRLRRREVWTSTGEMGHAKISANADDGMLTCVGVCPEAREGMRQYADMLPAAFLRNVDRFLAEVNVRRWQLPAFEKGGELVRLLRPHLNAEGLAWLAEVLP